MISGLRSHLSQNHRGFDEPSRRAVLPGLRPWFGIGLATLAIATASAAQNPQRVADINTANTFPAPEANWVEVLNAKLVISAPNPVIGDELWSSDGTPSGTELLKGIYPGSW